MPGTRDGFQLGPVQTATRHAPSAASTGIARHNVAATPTETDIAARMLDTFESSRAEPLFSGNTAGQKRANPSLG
jgi:hypothetical protein